MPAKMKQLRSYLQMEEEAYWTDIGQDMLEPGHAIDAGDILFDKIEDQIVEKQLDKLKQRSQEAEPDQKHYDPLKNQVNFNTFSKLDLSVGKIINASAIPKADKLLKLEVDIGFEKRTLVAGIARQYDPDEIVGRKIGVVANLAPKEMMGVVSQGMILMAQDTEGNFHFLETDAEPGSQIS
jgi:methionyl-tRNA synthetase